MKIGRLLIGGVAITIFDAVIGAITCGGIFNWVYELQPTNVWKPMDGPPGALVYVGILVLNLLFAFVYALIFKGIPGKSKPVRGIIYGLCVWAVGILPGMFATYTFMTVATTVVIYWTVLGVIQIPLKGLILAAIYGE